MSRIDELKDELRKLEMEELANKQTQARQKEETFRKATGIDVYTSDDYCGMSNGIVSFYFGYEVTMCPKHKYQETCERNDCDLSEWCFTADIETTEVMKLPASKISATEGEEPFWYLISGIALFLNNTECIDMLVKSLEQTPSTSNAKETTPNTGDR